MGLRYASVRHPNVVVMAPALTEAAQSQNFKLSSVARSSRLPLSLKKYKQKYPVFYKDAITPELKTSNGVRTATGMNGHSPPKFTYSINGLAKTLKSEFIPLEKKDATTTDRPNNPQLTSDDSPKPGTDPEVSDYTLTQIGGFIMNSGYLPSDNQETMGLQKSSKDLADSESSVFSKDKISPEMDQLFKNLGVVMTTDYTASSGELSSQNVEEILQVITSMENNGGDMCGSEISQLESGPSGDGETMFPMSDSTDITGTLSNFERDFFNVVDVMNICTDENLAHVSKDVLIKERIEEARKKEFQLKRKCEFLMRRLHKIQARAVGKHACEEITGVIEYTGNLLEAANRTKGYSGASVSDGDLNELKCDVKGVSLSSMSLLMRQLDHAATQQANSLVRGATRQCKYFGSGTSSNVMVVSNGLRPGLPGTIIPPFSKAIKKEMEQVAGELHFQLATVQSQIDSDLTASSSGCESCDEFISYNNQHQHQLTISKRAAWKWAEDRAAVACRWTWLQAQMADLEYKIRQQNEIRRQLRMAKGGVKLQGEPDISTVPSVNQNGYSGGEEGSGGGTEGCSRTRGLVRSNFGKRKLVQVVGLHKQSKKVARPASLRCSCRQPLSACALCTGRTEPTQPRDPLDVAPVNERLALLDPCFHPTLSFPSDVSQSLHYDAVLKCPEWQARAVRIPGKAPVSQQGVGGPVVGMGATAREATAATEPDHRRTKKHHLIEGIHHRNKTSSMALSVKLKRKIVRGRRRRKSALTFERCRSRRKSHIIQDLDGRGGLGDNEFLNEVGDASRFSPVPSPTPSKDHKDQYRRKRENSYDIDNIVIPYSVAASTRPEKLHYKEILTPKWRRVKEESSNESLDHKNGVVRRSSHDGEGEEDITEEAIIARHDRCEVDEKKKFLSYLKLPNSGLRGGRGQKRTDSRAESSGANTPDPMSPATRESGDPGGDNCSPLTSPPATPQAPSEASLEVPARYSSSCGGRRRTVSLSRPDPPKSPPPPHEPAYEVAPYEPRVFPLSDEVYHKMLSENESQHYTVMEGAPFKHYELQASSRPGSPSSVSTDSAESYLMEDPNDPEWTISHSAVDRLPNKR